MPVVKSYAIWNNKGGVGKSTILFHVASAVAAIRPDLNVLVIDTDPQASVTTSFLGGKIDVSITGLDELFKSRPQSNGKPTTFSGLLHEAYDHLRKGGNHESLKPNAVARFGITPHSYQVCGLPSLVLPESGTYAHPSTVTHVRGNCFS